MLRQFMLTLVEVMVGHLHGLDVKVQFLTRQQSFEAGTIVVADERLIEVAKLMLQGTFRFLGDFKGKVETAAVQSLHLLPHPGIESSIGGLPSLFSAVGVRVGLGGEEVLDLLCVLDLTFVIADLQLSDLLSDLRGDELGVNLLDLSEGVDLSYVLGDCYPSG